MAKRAAYTLPVESEDFILLNNLYNNNYRGFLRFANSYLNDMDVAEDFVADSFLVYWSNRNNLAPDSNVKVYILVVLKNKCLNYLRKKKVEKAYIDKMSNISKWDLDTRISTLEACDPQEMFSQEILEIVSKTLNSMPKKTLTIFKMSRYENKTRQQIAEEMEISSKAVEFHITKALNILRNELSDYLPSFWIFMLT